MYFSGKWPLMVAGTVPACVSNGFGVTVKLSADNSPSFEQDEKKITVAADKRKNVFFCIKLGFNSAASGTRTRTTFPGQGILSPSCLPIPPLRHGLCKCAIYFATAKVRLFPETAKLLSEKHLSYCFLTLLCVVSQFQARRRIPSKAAL